MPSAPYKRLPGRKRHFLFGHVSHALWMGDDHLLWLQGSFFSESYKRFHYRDIQALVIQPDRRWKMQGLFTGLFTLAALGLTFHWGKTELEKVVILWLFAWPFPLSFLVNLVKGPTCRAHLRTAIHAQKLPSLQRLRTASKAVEILKARIRQEQGILAEERWRALAEKARARPAGAKAFPVPPAGPKPGKVSKASRLHALLFALLLVDASWTALDLWQSHPAITLVNMLLSLALGFLTVSVLVHQKRSGTGGRSASVVWAAMGFLCVVYALSYVHYLTVSLGYGGQVFNPWRWARLLSPLPPLALSLPNFIYLFSMTGSLALGTAGLLLSNRFVPEASPVADASPLEQEA